ncbi:serine O-acetyltransferase [Aequorivita sinensis]|uniref:serine O-acetyltransferase n=1 Tax=Aequorivita sinensis TaxID=1382458 RepID=UPI00111D47A8|nr:transferase [Aequorivita sinensis]
MNLLNNQFSSLLMNFFRDYNHRKYWKRREIVIDPTNKKHLLIKLYFLLYIKRSDAKNNCSFGTNLNSGSIFKTPPYLPHGPNGIIIGHDLEFGENVIIYHQVTIAHGGGKIGDNVLFGAGSKVLPGKNIGTGAKIGMNAVVVEDIPQNATVVLNKSRIINK